MHFEMKDDKEMCIYEGLVILAASLADSSILSQLFLLCQIFCPTVNGSRYIKAIGCSESVNKMKIANCRTVEIITKEKII